MLGVFTEWLIVANVRTDVSSGSSTAKTEYHVANIKTICATLHMNSNSERSADTAGPNTRCRKTMFKIAMRVTAEKYVLTQPMFREGKRKHNIESTSATTTYPSVHLLTELGLSFPNPMCSHCVGESRLKAYRIKSTTRSTPRVFVAIVAKPCAQSRSPCIKGISFAYRTNRLSRYQRAKHHTGIRGADSARCFIGSETPACAFRQRPWRLPCGRRFRWRANGERPRRRSRPPAAAARHC
jgi:hypothetical protein